MHKCQTVKMSKSQNVKMLRYNISKYQNVKSSPKIKMSNCQRKLRYNISKCQHLDSGNFSPTKNIAKNCKNVKTKT